MILPAWEADPRALESWEARAGGAITLVLATAWWVGTCSMNVSVTYCFLSKGELTPTQTSFLRIPGWGPGFCFNKLSLRSTIYFTSSHPTPHLSSKNSETQTGENRFPESLVQCHLIWPLKTPSGCPVTFTSLHKISFPHIPDSFPESVQEVSLLRLPE